MQTQINNYEERIIPVTKIFTKNYHSKKSTVLNLGGARSSKSFSIIQLMIQRFVNEERKKFLTTRKTSPALKLTTYKLTLDLLKEYGIYDKLDHNKTDKTLYNPENQNFWVFTSIDDPEKIKSSEFNYIHMEEANEFTYEDFTVLKLRLSGKIKKGEKNQIFLSCNPSDFYGWVKRDLMNKEEHELIRSTYKDNPFLDREYIRKLEDLKNQDESYYKIYALGEFAFIKGLIFETLMIVEEFPSVDEEIYGLDFGFNNPTTLIWIGIKEKKLFLDEIIYETNLTNSQLIELMMSLNVSRKADVYADASEPARIEEIYRKGFNIKPADKSIKDGIDFLKRFNFYTKTKCIHIINEFQSYKWKTDKNGNILDEPLKFNDHTCDAIRYAVYTHLAKRNEPKIRNLT